MMTPEERKVYMQKYYIENKSYLQRYKRAWYQRNKADINERAAERKEKREADKWE